MSNHFLLPKQLERVVAFTLIAGVLFFSPYSVTINSGVARAEEASSSDSSGSPAGSESSTAGSGGEASESSDSSSESSSESSGSDSSGTSEETGGSETGDESGDGEAASDSSSSGDSSSENSVNSDAPASEGGVPAENGLQEESAVTGDAASGDAAAASETGDGGEGGETSDAGGGGDGGNAGAGGETGSQTGQTESESAGGSGGSGGGADDSVTVIDTGSATTSGSVSNQVNTGTYTFGSTTPSFATTTATSTSSDVDVRASNAATTTNEMDIASETGENAATTTGEAIIRTGDAIANADLLNVINTNFVNSFGELLFLSNLWKSSLDHLDLRSLGFFAGGNQVPLIFCATFLECRRGGTDIRTDSTASTTNELDVEASTGGNSILSNGSNLTLTGDAYAAANIMNLINSNFVNSDYLFMTYNSFGDWGGDIVFPNAESFLSALAQGGAAGGMPGSIDVRNRSAADILDDLTVSASAGGNTAASNGGSIMSGTSSSAANVMTTANQNLFGGSSLNLLFKVHGTWSGKVYGLPPGVEWKETADGFVLSFDWLEDAAEAERGSRAGLDISTRNDADIINAATVAAGTGGNAATSTDGRADIKTGDAYAAANVLNFVNTNVVGRNMFLAIINIFGDWSGDVAFGKPDLWIGGHAEIGGPSLVPGGTATYYFTVMNNGDVAATGVKISADLGSDYLAADSSGGRSVEIPVGTVRPGESASVSFEAVLGADAGDSDLVTTVAKVSAVERDNNPADNEERVVISLGRITKSRSWDRMIPLQRAAQASVSSAAELPKLSVSKTHTATGPLSASTTIGYKVVVHNPGTQPVANAKLHDRLSDSLGGIVNDEIWELGTIQPGEEVIIEYSVFFNGLTPSGFYTNSAYVSGFASSTPIASSVAVATVNIQALQTVVPKSLVPAPVSVSGPDFASSTEADSGQGDPEFSLVEPNIVLASDDSMLAAAFFTTPTGRQLAILTAVLIVAAVAVALLRRKMYGNV